MEPFDRPIAAMHLVDTPVTGIAEALRMAPVEVERRVAAMLRRSVRAESRRRLACTVTA